MTETKNQQKWQQIQQQQQQKAVLNAHGDNLEAHHQIHAEPCEPQMKIDTFIHAIKHSFPSPTMDLEKHEKSTKQTQTTEQPKMAQDPSSITSNSDTDSAYNTGSESNYTECLPRPSKSQQITNTKCKLGTKPSCIPVPNHTKSNSKTSHISTSTHLPKPSTSTRPDTQTTAKQPILPAPKTSTASTYHQRTRKTPLLPTPPPPVRNFCNNVLLLFCCSGLGMIQL